MCNDTFSQLYDCAKWQLNAVNAYVKFMLRTNRLYKTSNMYILRGFVQM